MVLKNITLYILSKTLPTSFYILAIHWEQSHVWGLVVRKESRLAESSLKWFLQKPISQIKHFDWLIAKLVSILANQNAQI